MKHTPIPKQLCSWNDEGKVGFAEPLPPDLDRLFRASPKLADALRDMMATHPMHGECKYHSCKFCRAAIKQARAALALLEN